MILKKRTRKLICACCGQETRGRQWWNQDTGWGICPKCARWIESIEGREHVEDCYGKQGIHWDVEQKTAAAKRRKENQ
jgi:hypothetical protein